LTTFRLVRNAVDLLANDHQRDAATGRPVRDRQEVIGGLSDTELAEELLVAAMARAQHRLDRFRALLAERDRRANAVPVTAVEAG